MDPFPAICLLSGLGGWLALVVFVAVLDRRTAQLDPPGPVGARKR